MHLFSTTERDIGVCATLKCPHCQAVTRFLLRQVRFGVGFLDYRLFELNRFYQICCSSCQFLKDLDARELFPAMRAKRLHMKLEAGEMAPSDYVKAIDALDFPSLHALREEAETWSCPKCQESVPASIDCCWKCNTTRSDLKNMAPTEDFQAPKLPWSITRPSNPWEGP